MNENLEEIADEISALTDKLMDIMEQFEALGKPQLEKALKHLLDAEDKVRFLL